MAFLFLYSQSLTSWIAVLHWKKTAVQKRKYLFWRLRHEPDICPALNDSYDIHFFSHSMAAIIRQVTPAPHVCAHVRHLCFTTWLRDKSGLKTGKCHLTSVWELLKVKRWINLIQSFWQNPLIFWCCVLYLVKSSMFVAVKTPSASHKSHPKHHE